MENSRDDGTAHAALHAWRLYAQQGLLCENLLRKPVFRAWERCHNHRVRHDLFHAPTLSALDTERLLCDEERVISAARPYLGLLSQAAAGERHAIMLGNAEAVVLAVTGDWESVYGPERVPGPGAFLNEASGGANGIGSPLAEGGYLELVGPEHFIQGFHAFSCQGVPIRLGDTVIASLSSSVRRPVASKRLRDILICAAHGIEGELLVRQLDEQVRQVLAAHHEDRSLLEQLRQDVVQSLTSARLGLQVAAHTLPTRPDAELQSLLTLAEQAIHRFQRQAQVWRMLASADVEPPERVCVNEVVQCLAELLTTEASLRRVTVRVHPRELVEVWAERNTVMRRLLRSFTSAFEAAGKSGEVVVEIHRTEATAPGTVEYRSYTAGGTLEHQQWVSF